MTAAVLFGRPGALLAAALLLSPIAPSPARAAPVAPVAILDAGAAAGGSSHRIELLTLRRIFSTIGIPADVVGGVDQLVDYRVAFVAGGLTNTALKPDLSNALFDFVETGGVLAVAGEVGSSLYPLFGITAQAPSRKRYRLTFSGKDAATAFITHPSERTISLGNGAKHFFDDVIWSQGAMPSAGTTVLGTFEDGTAGLSVHRYGRGRAYLLGMSFPDAVLLPQLGGSYNAERQYVNGFEPSADVIMFIVKAISQAAAGPAVSLATIPFARPVGLVLTHDVDAQSSFLDSLKFAALEEKYGAKSTFFITAKYFKDASDIDYFNVKANADAVRELARRGWEIGSHTVSHSVELASAPEGDPKVTQKTYDPSAHLTVQGETRVSKEVLDREIPGQRTVAYRSGDLAFPRSLIRVLQGAGYAYDSTYSANSVLTSFPYMAFEDQDMGSRESGVVEIPVTLDDSQGYLTPSTVAEVVKQWVEVVAANARYGGLTVLLVHPSDTRTKTYKLEAQEELMRVVESQGGWMGDLSTVGRFWRNRASLRFRVETAADGGLVIRLDRKGQDIDPAIGFDVAGSVSRVVVLDSEGIAMDFTAEQRSGRLSLGRRR